MIYLLDPDLTFIARKAFTPYHLARKLAGDVRWYTYCGRAWHPTDIGEWAVRESDDNDPDTFVCRACKKYAPDGSIRIEE